MWYFAIFATQEATLPRKRGVKKTIFYWLQLSQVHRPVCIPY
jgi:hypothetical protein